jgi:hypothetical protein
MHRARLIVAATLVATAATVPALAQQAPEMRLVLAGKTFVPPLRGEAVIQFMGPNTRRDGDEVVITFEVRNAAVAPIPRLTIAVTWYDRNNNVIGGGRGVINGLLQPGEVQEIEIRTPYSSRMNTNNFNFSHANGTVKPERVSEWPEPEAEPAADAAAAPPQ